MSIASCSSHSPDFEVTNCFSETSTYFGADGVAETIAKDMEKEIRERYSDHPCDLQIYPFIASMNYQHVITLSVFFFRKKSSV